MRFDAPLFLMEDGPECQIAFERFEGGFDFDELQIELPELRRIAWLNETGRRYVIGTARAELKRWSRELADRTDWRHIREDVEVKVCRSPAGGETFLLCRSASTEDQTAPAGLKLKWSARPEWDDWAAVSEGTYILRSNIHDWSDEELWKTYVQLSEAVGARIANRRSFSSISASPCRTACARHTVPKCSGDSAH